MVELLWWLDIQRVYAKSIGASFARPANDTEREALGPGLVAFPARSASPPEVLAPEGRAAAVEADHPSGVFSAPALSPAALWPETFPLLASPLWFSHGR